MNTKKLHSLQRMGDASMAVMFDGWDGKAGDKTKRIIREWRVSVLMY